MKYQADALLTLCRELLPEDPALVTEVEWSIDSPLSYLYLHQNAALWGRRLNLHKPLSNLPWFALLHGLKQRQLLFHFTHSQAKKRMAWVIKEGRFNGSFAVQHDRLELEKDLFIQLASHYLQSFHYVLCEFSPSPEGITMSILPEDVAENCHTLARASGYGTITLHTPDASSPIHTAVSSSPAAALPLYQHLTHLWKA